jgi:uncharacterized membrane protein
MVFTYGGISIIAAVITAVVGVVLQLSVLEVLAYAVLSEITAALGLALWLIIRDRNHISKERRPKKPWKTGNLACLGAFLGMSIAGVHVFWHLTQGDTPSEDPSLHFMINLIAGTLAGASLFASVSGFRNWLAQA